MDELVWGDQLLIHKEMSLAKINFEYSKMVGKMISLQFDPFDRTCILEEEMEMFVFETILSKMNKLIVSKILSHHY